MILDSAISPGFPWFGFLGSSYLNLPVPLPKSRCPSDSTIPHIRSGYFKSPTAAADSVQPSRVLCRQTHNTHPTTLFRLTTRFPLRWRRCDLDSTTSLCLLADTTRSTSQALPSPSAIGRSAFWFERRAKKKYGLIVWVGQITLLRKKNKYPTDTVGIPETSLVGERSHKKNETHTHTPKQISK